DYSISIIHIENSNFTQYPDNYYLKISKTDSIKLNNGDEIYLVDKKQEKIYSDNVIFKVGRFWVEENLPSINWVVKDSTATGNFMGREYQVKFNKKHNKINNPLKFQGLPGLITEIKSVNPD